MLSQGPFSTTYLKYIREGDDNVEDDINPDQDVDQVVEPVPPVCYKDRHILQQYRGLDKNDCRIIDYGLDRRELSSGPVSLVYFGVGANFDGDGVLT